MKIIAFIFLLNLIASVSGLAADKYVSLLQRQVEACEFNIEKTSSKKKTEKSSEVKTLDGIYNLVINGKELIKENVIYREITFETVKEKRQIIVNNDVISIFKVESEDSLIRINADAHQANKTLTGQINKLIFNTKIIKDWSRVVEYRSSDLRIELVKDSGQLTQLKIISELKNKTLDCQQTAQSTVCICYKK